MADAAVVIYNQAGDLIVDSRNVNMFLRYSGVTGADRYNNITVSCLDPVLFFRPISGFGGVDSMDMGGGTYLFRFRGQCEYYVFDRPWVTGGPIDIWDQNGRHIFMSTARPMNVVQTFDIPTYFDAYRTAYQDGWTFSGLPSSKYAYNLSYTRQGYNCLPAMGGGWETLTCDERITATANGLYANFPEYGTRYLGWAPIYSNTFLSYGGACPVSVIDVTGWL